MHFDQDLLKAKIEALLAIQNNLDYKPVKPENAKTSKADPMKAKERADKQAAKFKAAAEKMAAKERERQAKGVILARKNKRNDETGIAPAVGYTGRKLSASREKVLPTRPLNLEDKIRVRIDSKTEIYCDPGADIEAIKAKYKKEPLKIYDEKVPARKADKNKLTDDDHLKMLFSMKTPLKQIAKMLDVKPSSVKKAARYMGIKII